MFKIQVEYDGTKPKLLSNEVAGNQLVDRQLMVTYTVGFPRKRK